MGAVILVYLPFMAKQSTKAKKEKTLGIKIDDEAFDRLYGHLSHPIEGKGHKVAVRIISQFGEESTRVVDLSETERSQV